MKPAEHYREAERLLELAVTAVMISVPKRLSMEEAAEIKDQFNTLTRNKSAVFVTPDNVSVDVSALLAKAQVHATLAVAGSQLRSLGSDGGES